MSSRARGDDGFGTWPRAGLRRCGWSTTPAGGRCPPAAFWRRHGRHARDARGRAAIARTLRRLGPCTAACMPEPASPQDPAHKCVAKHNGVVYVPPMNVIRTADVPNSTPRVRRLRARRSAPSGLRGRLTGDTPAGAVRLAVVETLAGDLGLDLGAAVRLALAIPDTETAVASAVPRYAILADDRAIFATDPAALLRGGIPTAAVIIDLSAIVRAVLGETP